MLFADSVYLITENTAPNAIGDSVGYEEARQVFCEVKSIGLKRKMEAMSQGLKLEYKFILSDVAEYGNEEIVEYNGKRYNVANVYINELNQVELITARY